MEKQRCPFAFYHSRRFGMRTQSRPFVVLQPFAQRCTRPALVELSSGDLTTMAVAMEVDVRNWDEDAYRDSILQERETQCRTIFRSVFAPNPNPIPDIVVAAASDGSVASYSISSCLSSLGSRYCNSSPDKIPAAEPKCFLRAHEGPAYDVTFYGDGIDSLLLSCGDDGRIQGWRWKDLDECETPKHEQGSHIKPIIDWMNPQHRGPWYAMSPIPENNAIAVDHQGGSIFVAAGDSCAYSWDVETEKIKMIYKGHSDYLHCIVARECSNQIITGSEDGTARIWDCRNGKCSQIISPQQDKGLKEASCVRCIALDASGSWLAYGSGQSLCVWNLLAAEQISKIWTPTTFQDVTFDENHIWAVGSSPILSRMDMNGKVLSQIRCAPQSAFSVSLHHSCVVAVTGFGGLLDVISEYGSHLCTFRCSSV